MTVLYTGQTRPTGVALDVANRRMFWTADSEIRSAPMDGGTVTTLHDTSTQELRGVALLRAPTAITPPAVGGTPGRALSCDGAAWGADMPEAQFFRSPQTIGYRWFEDGDEIAGATASTYTAPDLGRYSCAATATNAAGSTTQTSATATVDPRVTVVKTLSPSTDAGRFDLLINGAAVRGAAGDGDSGSARVPFGSSATVAEAGAAGANLGEYVSTIDCGAGPRSGTSQVLAAVTRDTTCTIVNTRRPAPVIVPPGPPPAVAPATPRPTCEGRVATIVAVPGQTRIAGTPGADVIVATGAADTIDARGGADTICAGGRRRRIRGGNGTDVIRGGAGDDDVRGDAGDDLLLGGPATTTCAARAATTASAAATATIASTAARAPTCSTSSDSAAAATTGSSAAAAMTASARPGRPRTRSTAVPATTSRSWTCATSSAAATPSAGSARAGADRIPAPRGLRVSAWR